MAAKKWSRKIVDDSKSHVTSIGMSFDSAAQLIEKEHRRACQVVRGIRSAMTAGTLGVVTPFDVCDRILDGLMKGRKR